MTFLFSDVEGSTRLWEKHPRAMAEGLARHDALMRDAISRHDGTVFSTAGDAFAAAFHTSADAASAAQDAQEFMASAPWPDGAQIRVRMSLHAGVADERDGDYFGPTLNRAARIMAAGHGGQILVSDVTAHLLSDGDLVDLGTHRLKDLEVSERLWQLGSSERFPPLRVQDGVPNSLPLLRTEVLGRAVSVEAAVGHLERARLVSLVGLGGVGKTTLAVTVAARLAGAFADGVWFVDLAPLTEPSRVVGAIAEATGVRVSALDDPAGQLASLLASRSMLVVLDNCEHLLEAAAEAVDAVLERAPGVRWLVTSRERLDLAGEVVEFVEPLDWSGGFASPCAQLLVARARDLGVVLEESASADVVELCRRLDGLALAIELAAPNLVHLSPTELLARLDRRFELLDSARRGRRARRHASLRAVLDDTWELLPAASAGLLARLAAFPGTFDPDAAIAVADGGPSALGSLRDLVTRSLVVEDHAGDRRLRLLESVKVFTRERWGDDSDAHRRAHLDWVDATICLPTQEQRLTSWATWPAIERLWDDVAVAVEYALSRGRYDHATRLLGQCAYYTRSGGSGAGDVVRWAGQLLERDPDPAAEVHLALALAALGTRSLTTMARAAAAASERAHGSGETAVLGMSDIVCSWAIGIRDPAQALDMLDDTIEQADICRHHAIAAAARSNRSTFLLLLGRADEAASVCRSVLADSDAGDYAIGHSGILLITALFTTDPAEAVAVLRGLENPTHGTTAWDWDYPFWRAVLAATQGDAPAALAGLQQALSERRRRYDEDGLPDHLLIPALLAHRLGEHERLARYLIAVRRHPRPTQGFPMTILYRRLAATLAPGTLDGATDADAFAEALTWMQQLAQQPTHQ